MAESQGQPATVGGIPTVGVDVPISAVLIVLFIALAASHMTLLQRNNRRGHKFLMSGLLFGFCMSRIAACVMRIVWANRQTNTGVTIAAQIFVNAGVLLIYIINNILSQRLLRSALPSVGWNPIVRYTHKTILFLLLPLLVMVIVAIIQTFNTTNANIRRIDHDLLLTGLTYMTVVAVIPYFLIAVAVIVPWVRKHDPNRRDHFGSGTWRVKVIVLLASTSLACIEAGFRAGTTWSPTRPATHPAWYHSKAAFYCFNFMLDVIILTLLLLARIDLRFHVRNKANGPGDYSRPEPVAAASGSAKQANGDDSDVHTIVEQEDEVKEKASSSSLGNHAV